MAVSYVVFSVALIPAPEGGRRLLTWPDAWFLASAGAGILGAVAVSLVSWPIMNAVTRHDTVRYE